MYLNNEERLFAKEKFLKPTLLLLIVFIVSMWIGNVLVDMNLPFVMEYNEKISEAQRSKEIMKSDTWYKFAINLFVNNIMGSLLTFILGFASFGLFSVYGSYFNGFSAGIGLTIFCNKMGLSFIYIFIASILPHGIFEIPAYLISASAGMLAFKYLKIIVFGKDKENRKISTSEYIRDFKLSFITSFKIVLPLLIIAALIESTLSLHILKSIVQ